MAHLLSNDSNKALRLADPQLKTIEELNQSTAWMNGIQFYFKESLNLGEGHVVYLDSPWALTAVSQPQFWHDLKLNELGDGKVRDIVSVIISDWTKEGKWIRKPANKCTEQEIITEVLTEIADHRDYRNSAGEPNVDDLKGKLVGDPFLDRELRSTHEHNGRLWENLSPLFINEPNTWRLQPDAKTAIPNLFLAADYVRTFTQLATMEAANEAARRAVNSIIQALIKEKQERVPHAPEPAGGTMVQKFKKAARQVAGKSTEMQIPELCRIWDLHEPWLFWLWRLHDEWRYRRGLPWSAEIPWFVHPAQIVLLWSYQCYLSVAGLLYGRPSGSASMRQKSRSQTPNTRRQHNLHLDFRINSKQIDGEGHNKSQPDSEHAIERNSDSVKYDGRA